MVSQEKELTGSAGSRPQNQGNATLKKKTKKTILEHAMLGHNNSNNYIYNPCEFVCAYTHTHTHNDRFGVCICLQIHMFLHSFKNI